MRISIGVNFKDFEREILKATEGLTKEVKIKDLIKNFK